MANDIGENVSGTLPWVGTRFVDGAGNITEPWLQLLTLLLRRTGGAAGSTVEQIFLNNYGIETTFASPNPFGLELGISDVISSPAGTRSTTDDTGGDISAGVVFAQREFADIFAPLIQSIVRDILAAETTTPTTVQNAANFTDITPISGSAAVSTFDTVNATGSHIYNISDMIFAPQGSTAYTGAPVAITLTGSPMVVRAGRLISLSLDGSITNITYQRGTFSRGLPNGTPFILLDPGDILTIAYTGTPSIYAIPR